MSEVYIRRKHCRQRTGSVLGVVPFAVVAGPLSSWYVQIEPLREDLP